MSNSLQVITWNIGPDSALILSRFKNLQEYRSQKDKKRKKIFSLYHHPGFHGNITEPKDADTEFMRQIMKLIDESALWGWNEDWTRDGQYWSSPLPSIHPARVPSQPMHWDSDINQGQQQMSMKKRPGSRGTATINQELIQSCEMPRLINLCQHFLCCQAVPCVFPYPSFPTSSGTKKCGSPPPWTE